MKKIKITESQKIMLESKAAAKLKEDISYSQSGSKAVSDEFKKSGANSLEGVKVEGEIDEIQMSELAPKVLDFIKQLYTKPSMESLDPFWASIDVSWDELIQLLTELQLIKSVSGGYRLQKLDRVGGPTAVVRIVTKLVHKLINDKRNPVEEIEQKDITPKYLGKDLPTKPVRTGKSRAELLQTIARKRKEELDRRKAEANKPIGELEEDIETPSKFNIGDVVRKASLASPREGVVKNMKFMPRQGGWVYNIELTGFNGQIQPYREDELVPKHKKEMGVDGLEEDGGYPAGASNDPATPYNQVDPPEGKQPTQRTLELQLWVDEHAFFTKGGKLFVYNVESADNDEYEQYASRSETPLGRDEDGNMDVEYGEWEMDETIIDAYVNDNLGHLSIGKGKDDWENGVDMVEVDPALAQDLLGIAKYISNPKTAEAFTQTLSSIGLEETTSAAGGSSGSFVGKLAAGPIVKSNVAPEMETIVDGEEEQEPIMGHLDRLLNQGAVSPQEWLSVGDELKHIVMDLKDDSKLQSLVPYIVHMLQLAEKGMEVEFNALRDKLIKKIEVINPVMMEATTTISAGGDSGTFAYDAPVGDGSDFWTAGNKMAKKGKTNEVVAREGKDAKTDTQWPDGHFVEFDDCTKLNNNKVAQNGGCSTGAVDNVVKTKGSKNSVISDSSIYESIAKETGRTIEEVKSILDGKNDKSE